jgi:hypothetical protein
MIDRNLYGSAQGSIEVKTSSEWQLTTSAPDITSLGQPAVKQVPLVEHLRGHTGDSVSEGELNTGRVVL